MRAERSLLLLLLLVPAMVAGCSSRASGPSPTPPPLTPRSEGSASVTPERDCASVTDPDDKIDCEAMTMSPPASATSPTELPPTLAPADLRQYCHSGFPLEGVYSPWRLTILSPCAAVTGVVANTDIEHDGDLHISLAGVDPKWLNAGNLNRPDKSLVVEVVPDIPQPRPAVGDRITVIGPWVLDTQTGWREIHPVWQVLPAS